MDAVAAANVAKSIDAVNNVMKTTSKEVVDAAEKIVKVNAEIKLGPVSGSKNALDYLA